MKKETKLSVQARRVMHYIDDSIDVEHGELKSIIAAVFYDIKEEVARGDEVSIRNFGKFTKHSSRGTRMAHNFKTGESMLVRCKPRIKFTPTFRIKE